ncbi:MFS general substrate transporter [Peniophora sp. CONT]|nr:MFS general substrate transporter [Peniophora sp. CONT]
MASTNSNSVEKENDTVTLAPADQPTTTGKTEKAADEHHIPHNNLFLVFCALTLTVFLAALDSTIVATALPTIVAQLGGGKQYSWVGSSYLLAAATMGSINGKLSDVFGRKALLYPAIVIFLVGSALCGAAKTMVWLIVARAIQGLGGGAIIQMCNIIVGDITPLDQRAQYLGYLGATWGIASIIGPLIGGVLTDHASWRWCFWINLPTGGIALVLLFCFLHLNPRQGKPLREHIAEFDFLGLFLIIAGIITILLGFLESETSWSSPATIALLVVGVVTLITFVWWETYTKRAPIVPPRLFRTRTTALLLTGAFFHSFCYYTAAFYLPLYFQILGASATRAGELVLPFALTLSALSAGIGYVLGKMGDYRPIIWTSWALCALGYGLMIMLDNTTSLALQEIYTLVAGLGMGSLYPVPLIALQAAMSTKDMATSTGTFGMMRMLGSTVGVSIGQAIWTSEARTRTAAIANFPTYLSSASLAESVTKLHAITPPELKQQILHAYSKSISTLWIVNTPICCMFFFLTLLLKKYSLQRTIVRTPKEKDVEQQAAVDEERDKKEDTNTVQEV